MGGVLGSKTGRLFDLTGDVTRLVLPGSPTGDLAALAAAVGGDIEVIPFGPNECLVLNAEGKLLGLPRNLVATSLANGFNALLPGDYIAGKAVAIPSEVLNDE